MKNMTCAQFRAQMDAYLDGELREEALEAFMQHAQECPSCAEEMRISEEMLSMLHTMDEGIVMPLEGQGAWRRAVRLESKPKKKGFPRVVRWAGAVAAGLVLVLTGAMLNEGGFPTSGKSDFPRYVEDNDVYEYADAEYDYALYEEDAAVYEAPAEERAMGTSTTMSLASDGIDAASGVVNENQTASKIIRDARRVVSTTQFRQDLSSIGDLVSEYEGYYQSSETYGQEPSRQAEMCLKIPAQELDAFLTAVDAIGTVRSASESATDITAGYVDTQSRLEAKRDRLARLKELVAEAEDLEDLLLLEDKQNELLYEIESLEAQIKTWDGRIAYSTVNITLNEVEDKTKIQSPDPTLGMRVKEGFFNSLNALAHFGQGLIVFLAALVPQLVWIVPLGAIVLWIVLRRRKNGR